MKIRLNKVVCYFILLVGGFLVITAIGTENSIMRILYYLIFIVFGVYLLYSPYLVFNQDSLVMHAIIKSRSKIYKFESFSKLVIDNNTLYINRNGIQENNKVTQWMIDKADWQLLPDKISGG